MIWLVFIAGVALGWILAVVLVMIAAARDPDPPRSFTGSAKRTGGGPQGYTPRKLRRLKTVSTKGLHP